MFITRRHGHVFRMALHNEGDWRMKTWQRARQGELSCLHTPIPELCNAILNTCQMPSRFYIIPSNVNKSQTHILQERQGRWCIFDTGWSHWIDYLVKEDMMKVAWPGSNQIILVSGLKIVAKSQSELWRLITNSSAKFKADPVSGVYAKGYHMIGTNSANSAGDDHQ